MEPLNPRERMYHEPSESPPIVLGERGDSDILRNGSTSPVEDEKGMYSCDKCQYKAKQRSNLMRHYYTMHADLTDQLECCGQLYRTKGDFRQHVKTVHKQGYLCKICNRTFSRKALLKRHSYVHNGIREFKCEHCNYATSHKSNLERHFKVHTPLLRKRRCRLSYRITNNYPKHITVDNQHGGLSDHHSSINDKGHLLSPLSALPGCQGYGIGPLPGSPHHPWSKYPLPRDETMIRSHFPARSPLEEYENLIKAQLMKQAAEARRSFPAEEFSMYQHFSTPPHKPTPILGHHFSSPLLDQSRLKDTPGGCDTNCFCKSNAMWMLPVYQGFLSSPEIYAHLSNRSLNMLHHPRVGHMERLNPHTSSSRMPLKTSPTSRERNERSVYLQLLKMQESVSAAEKTLDKTTNEVRPAEKRAVERADERESEDSCSIERDVPSVEDAGEQHPKVPQSDQPLKKRYKRFFIENIK